MKRLLSFGSIPKTDGLRNGLSPSQSHKKSIYLYEVSFVETTQEKRPRGNPGKNPKNLRLLVSGRFQIQVAGEDTAAMTKFQHSEECFVLITNVSPKECEM